MRWDDDINNPAEEIKQLEETVKKNPRDANAYYRLGTAYECLKDFADAAEAAEKAVKLDPNNIIFQAFYSYANTRDEKHEKAIEALVALIELGVDESDYYVDVAQGVQRGMDKESALLKIASLRKEGKDSVANKLEEWLVKPV